MSDPSPWSPIGTAYSDADMPSIYGTQGHGADICYKHAVPMELLRNFSIYWDYVDHVDEATLTGSFEKFIGIWQAEIQI